MSRGGQPYRILSQVDADMIASPFGGEPIAPEDAYTRVTASEQTKREANRQWADIPTDPADIAAWMRGEPVEVQP